VLAAIPLQRLRNALLRLQLRLSASIGDSYMLATREMEAAAILTRSLGAPHAGSDSFGMQPFKYLPHTIYVAEHGLDHFEAALLTRRHASAGRKSGRCPGRRRA